jgi:hypothetical protein
MLSKCLCTLARTRRECERVALEFNRWSAAASSIGPACFDDWAGCNEGTALCCVSRDHTVRAVVTLIGTL